MAKSKRRTYRKRSTRRRMSKRRGFLGGSPALAETSATFTSSGNGLGGAGWVESKYGTEDQQYHNVFDIGSKTLGNTFTQLPASQMPTSQSLALIQSAGARRRRGRKSRKGGFLMGEVINQAIVPFGLVALQNKYGRRKSRMNKSRRSRKFRR
jgi:hypothetical protein